MGRSTTWMILGLAIIASAWASAAFAGNGCGLRNEECCHSVVLNIPVEQDGCIAGLDCIENVCVCGNAEEPCCPFDITNPPAPSAVCAAGFVCEANVCLSVNNTFAPTMSPFGLGGAVVALLGLGIAWRRRGRHARIS